MILCDVTIANKGYGQTCNYANSQIRAWLNDDFYKVAFNIMQQDLIQIVAVDNSLESTGRDSNSYICEDTNDKIFLPSYSEITNENFGFETDDDRLWAITDYNVDLGAVAGKWWLRSPDFNGMVRITSTEYGLRASANPFSESNNYLGIVPVLKICLS